MSLTNITRTLPVNNGYIRILANCTASGSYWQHWCICVFCVLQTTVLMRQYDHLISTLYLFFIVFLLDIQYKGLFVCTMYLTLHVSMAIYVYHDVISLECCAIWDIIKRFFIFYFVTMYLVLYITKSQFGMICHRFLVPRYYERPHVTWPCDMYRIVQPNNWLESGVYVRWFQFIRRDQLVFMAYVWDNARIFNAYSGIQNVSCVYKNN